MQRLILHTSMGIAILSAALAALTNLAMAFDGSFTNDISNTDRSGLHGRLASGANIGLSMHGHDGIGGGGSRSGHSGVRDGVTTCVLITVKEVSGRSGFEAAMADLGSPLPSFYGRLSSMRTSRPLGREQPRSTWCS